MGGQSQSVIVNVTPEQFYQVITDFEKYPEFLSSVKTTEIMKTEGHAFEVYFEIDLIKSIKYTLQMNAKPNGGLSWSLLSGDIFKVNSGSWELEAAQNGKATQSTYTTEIEFNMFVPKMITNKLTSVSLPTTLKEFKDRAESIFA